MVDKVKTYQVTLKAAEEGKIEGQIVPYNTPDGVGDVFLPGSIDVSQKDTPMLWQHSGLFLVGLWKTLKETSSGVQATGEMLLETNIGKDVSIYVKKGIVKGISVGVSVLDWKVDEDTGGLIISKAILREASIVMNPAYEDAQVSGYKSEDLSKLDQIGRAFDRVLKSK